MSRRGVSQCSLLLGLMILPGTAWAGPITVIDFESFNDSDVVTTQLAGLVFSNTIIFTAGVSLNELEFPPHSGSNVASDNGGPISISFLSPVFSVGAYFTYTAPLTLTAFDSSNNQVASATSAFVNNEALSGNPGSSPNELLLVSFAGGISSITAVADPNGGSFTLDDLTYQTGGESVPEPGTLSLLALGVVAPLLAMRRRPTL